MGWAATGLGNDRNRARLCPYAHVLPITTITHIEYVHVRMARAHARCTAWREFVKCRFYTNL